MSQNQTNRYDSANIFSKLYAWYVFEFLWQYYRKPFRIDSIDPCSKRDLCDILGDRIRKPWQVEVQKWKNGKSASLPRAVMKSYGWVILCMSVINFIIYGGIRLIMPVVLGLLIRHANLYKEEYQMSDVTNFTAQTNSSSSFNPLFPEFTNKQNTLFYAGVLCILILLNFILSHPYFMESFRMGVQIRVAITRLVYEKALRITNNTVQRNTVGKIVNLISNDANRLDMCFTAVFFVYLAPIQTAIALYILSFYIGRAWIGCLVAILLYFPMQAVMAHVLSKFRSKSILLTDDRLRLMAEILPAMRVIKMYVWEKPFSALVHVARKLEITKIRHSMILRSINLAIFFVSNKLMAFVCILIYLLEGKVLNAELVFVSLSLIYQIREVMTFFFPLAVSYFVETYISLKRIEKFLLEEEISLANGKQQDQLLSEKLHWKDCKISLKSASVKNNQDGNDIIKDITFQVVPGKLTVIIGPVGSGKTSILLSILRELSLHKGSIDVAGKLIYVSQEAWIFSGTVRENILFGQEFDSSRYNKIVKVAALQSDFDQFANGDQTVVDDRGTSLSGGQRARISLARALYTDSDCFLLDDPLSAVDAAVAKHLFDKCIKDFLKKKCVILVTHQLQFVKAADQIIVLKNGSCLACGTYSDVLNKGIDLFKYSGSEALETSANEDLTVFPRPSSPSISSIQTSFRFRNDSFNSDLFRSRTESLCSVDSSNYDNTSLLEHLISTNPLSSHMDDVNKEYDSGTSSESGKSNLSIYWTYVRMGAGFCMLFIFFTSSIITQVLFTGTDYWLSLWTDYQEKVKIDPDDPSSNSVLIFEDENANIILYSVLVGLLFICGIIRTISFFVSCMRSSVNLHNNIFVSMIRAPIVFFEKTPVGIIMNRVSRDLGIIDDILPPAAFEAIEILGNSLAVFILCACLNYFILIPFFILMVMLYIDLKFYVNTARNLKRLEGSARSPLFNQMASTLGGLSTIRSYNTQDMFVERFSQKQNIHTSTMITFLSASRLFGISMELMCLVYIFCLIWTLTLKLDDYSGSLIGLTISQSLSLTSTFNWGVRQYTEVETYMTSVERVIEFGKLDKEELDACKQEPSEDWPSRGDIVLDDVSLRYSSIDPPVLKNLKFEIKGGEKIGIVGRTGAGKSSIIATLFRLTQPTGSICIDGIDTGTISLSRLRKSLSIIPQEPILFSGTFRRNLDPFNEKNDLELWDAVEKVQLKSKVLSLTGKLDSPLSDGGADFSVGQKQLICLARAILRKNRVLVLDEATANVDPRTDNLIQETIRSEFEQCTVLTIAHRLNTIIDYDRVLVLDKGEMMQFDTPHNLINKSEGIFFELFDNLNPDMKNELRRQAKKTHEKNSIQKIQHQQSKNLTYID